MSIGIQRIPRVIDICRMGKVHPLFEGVPGSTKTSQCVAYAEKRGMGCVLYVMPQHNAPDMMGYPVPHTREDGRMVTVFSVSALLDQVYEQVKQGFTEGVVIFDEFNAADVLSKKVVPGILSEGMIDGHPFPDGWKTFILTGNRDKDKSQTTQTPAHMTNRVSRIEVVPNYEGWYRWASEQGMHPLYIGAVGAYPTDFITQTVPKDGSPFPTLRTVTMCHDAHMAAVPKEMRGDSMQLPMDTEITEIINGLIGNTAGSLLASHLKNWRHMPTQEEVLKTPDTARVPPMNELGAMYSIGQMVVDMVTPDNMDAVWTYAQRLMDEMVPTIAVRITEKHPGLIESEAFGEYIANNADYLGAVL